MHQLEAPGIPTLYADTKCPYTSFAQALRPRSLDGRSYPLRDRSHSRTGTVKPVLGRDTTASGNGHRGACSIVFLLGGSPLAIHFPVVRSNSTSTSGTRISRECAIPAQSESRKSWLRMYQQDSKH